MSGVEGGNTCNDIATCVALKMGHLVDMPTRCLTCLLILAWGRGAPRRSSSDQDSTVLVWCGWRWSRILSGPASLGAIRPNVPRPTTPKIVVPSLWACNHQMHLPKNHIGSITLSLATRRCTPSRLLSAGMLSRPITGERATDRLGVGTLLVPILLGHISFDSCLLYVILYHQALSRHSLNIITPWDVINIRILGFSPLANIHALLYSSRTTKGINPMMRGNF